MRSTIKAMVAAGLLAAVVVGVLVFYGGAQKPVNKPGGLSQNAPDLVMTGGVSLVEMEGEKTIWKADAEAADYNIEAATLNLKKVYAQHLKDSTPEYELTGDTGIYDSKTRIMNMKGNVNASSFSGYHLKTDSLLYDVDNEHATTDAPVSIWGEGLNLDGVGMELDMKTENMKLLNDVKLVAVPSVIREQENKNK